MNLSALIPTLDSLPIGLRGPALSVLAETEAEAGRFAAAAELFLAAAAFFEATVNPRMRDDALVDAMGLLARSGHLGAAEATLDTLAAADDSLTRARALMSRGCVRGMQRRDAEAAADFRDALSMMQDLESPVSSLWLDMLGCRFGELVCGDAETGGRLESLRDLGETYRHVGYGLQGTWCDLIAVDDLIVQGRHDAALRVLDALESQTGSESSSSLLIEYTKRRATALRGAGRCEAAAEYDRLIGMLEASGSDFALACALDGRAKLAELPGQIGAGGVDVALGYYRASAEALERGLVLAAIDEIRAEHLRRALPDPFASVCRLLLDRYGQRQPDGSKYLQAGPELTEVLNWSERGRSAAFRADLLLGGSRPVRPKTDLATATEVASALGGDELLVAFMLTADVDDRPEGLITVVVDAAGPRGGWFHPAGGNRASQVLGRLRSEVYWAEQGEFEAGRDGQAVPWIDRERCWDTILQELGELLLRPWLSSLVDECPSRIVFVPHGKLHDVPFAALMLPDVFDGYLIERLAVIVDPQASTRCLIRRRRRAGDRPVVIGRGDGGACPLVYAEDVVEAAQPLANEMGGLTVCTSASELLEAAKDASVCIVYGHGWFLNDSPLDSYFALGGGLTDSERLTARAVIEHHADLDLFVAAACDSMRGRIAVGEALQGFRRATLTSARCTIGTQWKVWEVPTQALLRHFLSSLASGLDTATALRDAQLELMRGQSGYDARHPFYWAGLLVSGEPVVVVPNPTMTSTS